MEDPCGLPLEIWHNVFDLLPNIDLKSFASTSHYLRSLALPKLFATVCLRFAHFGERSFLHGGWTQCWDQEKEQEEVGKSLEVLLKMAEPEGVLRNMVRSLHVFAIGAQHGLVFEKHHLRLALRCLTNLRHFSWNGGDVPSDVVEEIAASCPCLESVRVHGLGSEVAGALRSLSLRNIELIDPCESTALYRQFAALGEILDQDLNYLRKLALTGSIIRSNSSRLMGVATRLTSLAINDVYALPCLGVALRQASVLESLTLLDVTSLAFLPCNEDSLPNIQDLKLGIDPLYSIDSVLPDMHSLARSLLAFIRLHTNLRRFDFSLWPIRHVGTHEGHVTDANIIWFLDIMGAVCALEGVQALGISFPALGEYGLLEALVKLGDYARSIRTCTALRLGGVSDALVETAISSDLRGCTFIALSNTRPMEYVIPKYPVPSIEELVFNHGLTGLKQACLYGKMYDVELSTNVAEEGLIVKPWRTERVRERAEADFCSLDAYWLMSYRTIVEEHEFVDLGPIEGEGVDINWMF